MIQAQTLRPQVRPVALGSLTFVVLGVAWEAAARAHVINTVLLSSPSAIAAALAGQIRSGALLRNLEVSSIEFAAGFAVSALIGLAAGVAIGWYRPLSHALGPPIWLSYNAPFVALSPLFILALGLGTRTVIVIVVLIAVVPIIMNTAAGVRNVDPVLVRAARSFGAGDVQLFRKVVLPASVPLVMAGLRLGVGRALVGVIVGEFFGGNAGLGYSITYYGGVLQTDNMMVGVVVTAAIGVLLTVGSTRLERRLDAWRGAEA